MRSYLNKKIIFLLIVIATIIVVIFSNRKNFNSHIEIKNENVASQSNQNNDGNMKWFSNIENKEENQKGDPFMDVTGFFDLGGLNVNEYVSRFVNAANNGNATAAFNIYRAETICANIPAIQEQINSTPIGATNNGSLEYQKTTLKNSLSVCKDFNVGIKERLSYLDMAAKNGSPEAQVAFLREGPYGDGQYQKSSNNYDENDPYLKEWRIKAVNYVEKAANQGNKMALIYLSNMAQEGTLIDKNETLSLTYLLVLSNVDENKEVPYKSLIEQAKNGLTEDQINSANLAAKQFITNIKK